MSTPDGTDQHATHEPLATNSKKYKKRERSPNVTNQHYEVSKKYMQTQGSTGHNSNQQQSTGGMACATQATNNSGPISATQVQPSGINGLKKEKQRPETWNKIEQQLFFNALRQNGKNFEAITQYFNARQKRYKIDSAQRSKEQIRHFYYRTWHKIIKYISIPDDQPIRDVQVSCLIAFNALMNKLHRWNTKSAPKLVELINYGWTTVRDKGKITRLKMPICKTTKLATPKLEPTEQLPQALTIYLEPKNDLAFCRIQKLAQNPYLCVDVQSTQTIKFVVSYLETKWKDRRTQFFHKCDQETDTNKQTGVFNDDQLVLYPDAGVHDFRNLEIETVLNQQDDDLGAVVANQQPQSSMAPDQQTTSMQSDTSTTAPHIQRVKSEPSVRVRLKMPEDSGVDKSLSTTIKRNQGQPDLLLQLVDEDDGVLTNTEDDDDRDTGLSTAPQVNNLQQQSATKPMGRGSSSATNKQQNKKQQQFKSEINADQLKCGFATRKPLDFTFIQLYLALNKPNQIKFKYEWVPSRQLQTTSHSAAAVTNEDLDKQRFYIDVLSHVAQAYLSEIKVTQEFLLENRLSSNGNPTTSTTTSNTTTTTTTTATVGNKKIQQLSSVSNQAISTSYQQQQQQVSEPLKPTENTTTNMAVNEAKKILDEMNKSRKTRQRKALVVKTNRSARPQTDATYSQLGETPSVPVQQAQSNIVLSGPVAAVARKIVNLSSENDRPQSRHQPSSHFQNLLQNSSIVAHSQALHQNYSNIMPQTFDENNFVDSTNYPSSCSGSSTTSTCSAQQQQQQQHGQYMMQVNGDNQQNIGLDVSLLDITLNTESVFNLNESSNMSSLTTILNSLQCKQFMSTNSIPEQEPMQQQQQQQQQQHITFNMPQQPNMHGNSNNNNNNNNTSSSHSSIHNFSVINNHVNPNSSHAIFNINPSTAQQAHTTQPHPLSSTNASTFKRHDTIEWNENDAFGDISLTSFLNEFQTPEKKCINVLNENSRDSMFFNMDGIMDVANGSHQNKP